MTKNFIIIFCVLLSTSVLGQAIQSFNYQALVRDSDNDLLTNSLIGVQISILQGSSSGTSVYIEQQVIFTDANGVISLMVGTGTVVSGVFSAIDWSNGPYFQKTETDPTGGANYTITNTSQLLSVPYALFADGVTGPQGDTGDTGPQGPPGADGGSGPTYTVGQFAQGGIVFWVDESATKGLVCAKIDQSPGIRWYAGSSDFTQAMGDGPYAGEMNTALIISGQVAIGDDNSTYAARICAEYKTTEGGKSYGDWYLPSKVELNLMYQNRAVINATAAANLGNDFVLGVYWSSTEVNRLNAWRQGFHDGVQFSSSKDKVFVVRAIRAF